MKIKTATGQLLMQTTPATYKRPHANIERHGWRDERISKRHRQWGVSCSACDIDFFLIEHYRGTPVALVEYKHYLAGEPKETNTNLIAQRLLATKADVPFIVALYWPEYWAFRVFPMNYRARVYFTDDQLMTEKQFVAKLHDMRNVTAQESMLAGLCNFLPDDFR